MPFKPLSEEQHEAITKRLAETIPYARQYNFDIGEDFWKKIYVDIQNWDSICSSDKPFEDILRPTDSFAIEVKFLGQSNINNIANDDGLVMHPASGRFIDQEIDANEPQKRMKDMFEAYLQRLRNIAKKINGGNPDLQSADIRWGMVCYNREKDYLPEASRFKYFESEVEIPDPDNYYPIKQEESGNLWIYKKPNGVDMSDNISPEDLGPKLYSFTTDDKLQPYIRKPADEFIYEFNTEQVHVDDRVHHRAVTVKNYDYRTFVDEIEGESNIERFNTLMAELRKQKQIADF